ncbi:MAG: sensor histidine kinase [Mycobacteriales bacterium]
MASGPQQADYAQASRLLTQLRTIARQLPGTLDPGGIAEHLLDELRGTIPADNAAVFTAGGGGRLEILAQRGTDRAAWETSLDRDSAIAEAWATQQPQLLTRSAMRLGAQDLGDSDLGDSDLGDSDLGDSDLGAQLQPPRPATGVVLPLVTGVRTVGLIVLESAASDATPALEAVERAAAIARGAALRLETALLFDDVRSIATAAERQRLAREIHDGIAQELVIVGYALDNSIAELAATPPRLDLATEQLSTLRSEVTRMITELRLSLFELRSDVDRHGGLGSAIAEYARTVGNSAGLRVHLSLGAGTARLPAAVESELLRVAQEAITNARKHACATNLWVSCDVDPPRARLQISDDGAGIDPQARRKDSYGMSIMAERAARVRANLTISERRPRGTTVSVSLGGE